MRSSNTDGGEVPAPGRLRRLGRLLAGPFGALDRVSAAEGAVAAAAEGTPSVEALATALARVAGLVPGDDPAGALARRLGRLLGLQLEERPELVGLPGLPAAAVVLGMPPQTLARAEARAALPAAWARVEADDGRGAHDGLEALPRLALALAADERATLGGRLLALAAGRLEVLDEPGARALIRTARDLAPAAAAPLDGALLRLERLDRQASHDLDLPAGELAALVQERAWPRPFAEHVRARVGAWEAGARERAARAQAAREGQPVRLWVDAHGRRQGFVLYEREVRLIPGQVGRELRARRPQEAASTFALDGVGWDRGGERRTVENVPRFVVQEDGRLVVHAPHGGSSARLEAAGGGPAPARPLTAATTLLLVIGAAPRSRRLQLEAAPLAAEDERPGAWSLALSDLDGALFDELPGRRQVLLLLPRGGRTQPLAQADGHLAFERRAEDGRLRVRPLGGALVGGVDQEPTFGPCALEPGRRYRAQDLLCRELVTLQVEAGS